jgi:hypothetical protein
MLRQMARHDVCSTSVSNFLSIDDREKVGYTEEPVRVPTICPLIGSGQYNSLEWHLVQVNDSNFLIRSDCYILSIYICHSGLF